MELAENGEDSVNQLLAIDIGNTHIKIGLYENGQWIEDWRLSTDPRRTADEYRIALLNLIQNSHQPSRTVEHVAIASVVPLLTPAFIRVGEVLSQTPPREISPPGYGMTVRYRTPESLGADRFVNALAAYHLVRDTVVVVDVGTTATIDVVSADGTFMGGAIAPGPHFLSQALAQGTAKLPLIAPVIPNTAIGESTAEAVAIGVGHGFIGMVNALVERTWQALGAPAEVVITGGWSRRILPLLSFPARLEPMLTMEGLRLAAQWDETRSD